MNVEGFIKMFLIMEMLAGNPTINEYRIDLVAGHIMHNIAHLPTSTSAAMITPIINNALIINGIELGAR